MWAESAVIGMGTIAFHTMNDIDFVGNVSAVLKFSLIP